MNSRKSVLAKHSPPITVLVCLVSVLLLFILASPLQAAEGAINSPFQDLASSNEYFRYVKFLQDKGVINGFPDGTFRPYASLTRAEAAKMLITAMEVPLQVPEQPTYTDVPWEHWAYPYIETATALGLLNGYPDGSFQPQRQLTRAETAVLLYRTYGIDYEWSGDSQAVDLPAWASGAANSIIDAGLMGVDEEKRFQPNWAATRLEFSRALALLHTIRDDWRLVPLKATLVPKAGVVQIQKPGQNPVTVSQPTVLAVDDVVFTGTNGEAEIRFEDGSAMLLTANAEMKVQKLLGTLFILPDGTGASAVEDLQVEFLKGSMFGALASRGVDPETLLTQTAATEKWSLFPLLALAGDNWAAAGYWDKATLAANDQVAPIDINSEEFKNLPPWKQLQLKKVKVKVNMPTGVAAVRGSFWKTQLEQVGDRIRVIINFIHGEGEVQSGEQTVAIRAGEKTTIEEPGAPPTPPEPMTAEEKQEWVAMKEWITERVQEIQERLAAPPVAPPPTPAGEQPASQQGQQQPSTAVLTQVLESLQQLLNTMEALEQEFGLSPAQPAATDDDDDDDYGGGGETGPIDQSPVIQEVSITGLARVNELLTAIVQPSNATVSYQWLRGDSPDGAYETINGATAATYSFTASDVGKWIKVRVTGTGSFTGTLESQPFGPVTGLIQSGYIGTAADHVDDEGFYNFRYELNIKFFGNQGFKVLGLVEDVAANREFIKLEANDQIYLLSIYGEDEEQQTFVPLDFGPNSYGASPLTQLSLPLSGELDPNKKYYAQLYQEDDTEIVELENYPLTPLGFATVDLTDLVRGWSESYSSVEDWVADKNPFIATLAYEASGQIRQFHTVYLPLNLNNTGGEYRVTASFPLPPGMAKHSPAEGKTWSLIDIGYFSHYPLYYYPKLELQVDQVDWDQVTPDTTPATIDEITAIHYDPATRIITTIIKADDPSGIAELIAIFKSPSGRLVPSTAHKQIGPNRWAVENDIGEEIEYWSEIGEWSLVGLITKDGAGNWVIPDMAGLEFFLSSKLGYELYVPHDLLISGHNPENALYQDLIAGTEPVLAAHPLIAGVSMSSFLVSPGDRVDLVLDMVNPEKIDTTYLNRLKNLVNIYGDSDAFYSSDGDIDVHTDEITLNNDNTVTIPITLPAGMTDGSYSLFLYPPIGAYEFKTLFWVANAGPTVREVSPLNYERNVSITSPTIHLTFNGKVQLNTYLESISLKKIGEEFGETVTGYTYEHDEYFTYITLRFDSNLELEEGQEYVLTIPEDTFIDESGETNRQATLTFFTEGVNKFPTFNDLKGPWIPPSISLKYLFFESASGFEGLLWVQVDDGAKRLIHADDWNASATPGELKVWKYGYEEEEPATINLHGFYLPGKVVAFDANKPFILKLKGANLPAGLTGEHITVTLSSDYPDFDDQQLPFDLEGDVLAIEIPPGLDPKLAWYYIGIYIDDNPEDTVPGGYYELMFDIAGKNHPFGEIWPSILD